MDTNVEKFNTALEFAKNALNFHHQLKTEQIDCIRSVVEKQDTLALLRTGFGKSIIYTLLPIVLDVYNDAEKGENIVMVISPLVALMQDQCARIESYGINAFL